MGSLVIAEIETAETDWAMDFLWTILVLLIVVGLVGFGAWFLKGYLWTDNGSPNIFGGGREKRIALVDSSSIDGRRKLLLIRRDGVEHLIMTGGPIDVVIETGIQDQRLSNYERAVPQAEHREQVRQPQMNRLRQTAHAPSLDQQ